MIDNKRFQSNETQEIVSVVGDNGVFYNLSNGANIKKDIFFQKYSEMVDANSFFQQQRAAGLAGLTEKIKTVDTRNIPPGVKVLQESVSEQVAAPAQYREMLLRKFEQEQAHKDLSQYKVYENEDDAANDFEKKIQLQQPQRQQQQRPRPPQQYQDGYQPDPYQQPPVYQQPAYQAPQEPQYQQPQQEPQYQQPMNESVGQPPAYVSPEEEAFRFFKSFKKVYPIKLSVDFDERIAEPNFIKLMAVNYNGDIIKFYTKEFMNRIYNDPGFLENKIYDKLKKLVFEEEQAKEKKPRAKKVTPVEPVKKPTPKRKTIPSIPKEDREKLQLGNNG